MHASPLQPSPPGPLPCLQAKDLSCRRGGHLLFTGLSLQLSPGEVLWLRGANGRGKSSLLRMLAGLGSVTQGDIRRRAPVLYLGHQDALKAELSAFDALSFLLALHAGQARQPHGCNMAAAVRTALNAVGLGARSHLPVGSLSQGQRKRVALARLHLSPPGALWLLDEPLDALDEQGIASLMTWVHQHRARGGAVLMSSHQAVPGSVPILDMDAHAPRPTGATQGHGLALTSAVTT